MVAEDKRPDETVQRHCDEEPDEAEARFAYELFGALARQDQDAYRQILDGNSELKEKYEGLDQVYTDLREALSENPDLVRNE